MGSENICSATPSSAWWITITSLGSVKPFPLKRGDNPTVLWNSSISGLSKILAYSSNIFEILKVKTVVSIVIKN